MLVVAAAIVVVLLAVQFVFGFFLPIYTDEFGFKWNYARAHLDDHKVQLLTISCRADPTLTWPSLWRPARWFDAMLYEDLSYPTKLRWFGFGYAAVFLTALYFLVRRAAAAFEQAPAGLTYVFALSFCSLGILPFLLVMNRPEIDLAAGVAVLLLLTLQGARRTNPWAIALLIALVQYYLFAHHPKSILLLPFFLAAWLVLRLSAASKLLGMAWIGFLALSLHGFYARLLECPLDGHIRSRISSDTLNSEFLVRSPEEFFKQALDNLFGSFQYVTNAGFRAHYLSWWLPNDAARGEGLAALANIVLTGMWLFAIGVVAIALVSLLVRASSFARWDRSERTPALLFLGLSASLVMTCMAQINRNDYRSTQILLMLLLCVVLAAMLPGVRVKAQAWRTIMWLAFLSAVISQAAFLWSFEKYVNGSWRVPGPAAGQLFSLNHVRYSSFRPTVVDLARECGISEQAPADHLVLDDVTYPVFWRSRLPYHLVFIGVGSGWGEGIADLRALLKERNAGGVVATCDKLPRSLRSLAKEKSHICCIPAHAL